MARCILFFRWSHIARIIIKGSRTLQDLAITPSKNEEPKHKKISAKLLFHSHSRENIFTLTRCHSRSLCVFSCREDLPIQTCKSPIDSPEITASEFAMFNGVSAQNCILDLERYHHVHKYEPCARKPALFTRQHSQVALLLLGVPSGSLLQILEYSVEEHCFLVIVRKVRYFKSDRY